MAPRKKKNTTTTTKKGKQGDADKDNDKNDEMERTKKTKAVQDDKNDEMEWTKKTKAVEDLSNDLIKTWLTQPEDDDKDSNVEISSSDESEEENENDKKPKAKEHGTPLKKGATTLQRSSPQMLKKMEEFEKSSQKNRIWIVRQQDSYHPFPRRWGKNCCYELWTQHVYELCSHDKNWSGALCVRKNLFWCLKHSF